MIAALYVATGGCYIGLDDVDPWPVERDARLYAGPWPVVAHPPCERWSKLARMVETRYGYRRGDDGGCFAAALRAVRDFGGVIEHPAHSEAWAAHSLNRPSRAGWVSADLFGGWTCQVEQGHYGHAARKPTWLYAAGVELPSLKWGPSPATAHTRAMSARRMAERGRAPFPIIPRREVAATPIPFRDLLISIARTALVRRAA